MFNDLWFFSLNFHLLVKFQLTFWFLFVPSNEKATFEPQGPPELELNPVSESICSIIIPFMGSQAKFI